MLQKSPNVPFLSMEDVYVTGMLREAVNISYTQIEGILVQKKDRTDCALQTYVKNMHKITPSYQHTLWKNTMQNATVAVACEKGQNNIVVISLHVDCVD
jgi:hypothetical protein